jgi:putative ABC transport system permease protein
LGGWHEAAAFVRALRVAAFVVEGRPVSSLGVVLAQLRRRPLQTLLGVVLLALGIATLVFVTLVQTQLTRQLERDARGVDLVVGAKGSPLQLVLSAVYQVDIPTGNVPLGTVAQLRANRLVAQAVPLSMGDSYRGFRLVGTEPGFLELHGAALASGRLWQAPMEAVLGAEAARVTGLAVGGEFTGTHGLAPGGAVHEDARYRVVGVLAPAGGVIDRLVLTDTASIWHVHEGEIEDEVERRQLEAEREVTAILVRYASPMGAAIVPRQVNAESRLMAASPASELARLFAVAGVGVETMRGFAWVLVAASLLALFVTLFNALEQRRYDIAIMRLLGASRARVAALLLLESWLLALAALALGLGLGLAAVNVVGGWLSEARAFALSARDAGPALGSVLAVALAVATLAAALPAWRAARMDIWSALSQG